MIYLLWDFDNTLAYRDGMWTQSLCNVLKDNGYQGDFYEAIKEAFNTGFPWQRHTEAHQSYFKELSWWQYVNTLISNAINTVGITDKSENQYLTEQFKQEYLKESAWHLYDDTIPNLKKAVDKGHTNIILSNHVPELHMLIDRLNISKYFKQIVNSAIIGYEKPNCHIYTHVLSQDENGNFIMIGDNYYADIKGALNCSVNDAILVRKENSYNYPKYSKDLNGIWKYIDR